MNRPTRRPPVPRQPSTADAPLTDADVLRLQTLLDAVPPPAEPLDASMLDGFLCGVLVQPRRVPTADWLPTVLDAAGGAAPRPPQALADLLQRRHAELDAAIERRDWFDPWVFEMEGGNDDDREGGAADSGSAFDEHADDNDAAAATASSADAVYPWVAGFVLAMETFPGLMAQDARALLEPLALLYRHLAPDDLEDADDLLDLIETLEPLAALDDAVEELVRATLLLADVSRPRAVAPAARRPASTSHGAKRSTRR